MDLCRGQAAILVAFAKRTRATSVPQGEATRTAAAAIEQFASLNVVTQGGQQFSLMLSDQGARDVTQITFHNGA